MTGQILYERWRDNHAEFFDLWEDLGENDRKAWEALAIEVDRYYAYDEED
jgi:hypothetical protein